MVRSLLVSCGAALALSACSFSFGGLDYEKAESGLADVLNESYSSFNQKVSNVDCPEQSPEPKKGDHFECTAEIGGQTVRVDSEVLDDDYNINFNTKDKLYELAPLAGSLSESVSQQVGFDVTVDCGEGLKAVEVGKTLDCTATDPQGEERILKVTAAPGEEDDPWTLVD